MKNYVKEYKGHKVPEGATHWQESSSDCYMAFIKKNKKGEASSLYFVNDEGNECFHYELVLNEWMSDKGIISCEVSCDDIELPEAQEWNGEGLPPVGTVCEVNIGATDVFEVATIMYISNQIVISSVGGHEFSSQASITKFRPLKTQQEKDREAFVECVKQLLPKSDTDDLILSGKLFDLGFTAPKAGE